MRKLFLVLFLIDTMACSVLTPWMGLLMRLRAEELLASGQIAPSPLDWICPIVWGCYGPIALAMAIGMIGRYWNNPAAT